MSRDRKILNTTVFRGEFTEDKGKQWFWTTIAPNGNVVGDGGEGYNRLDGAVNGFFSQQGIEVDKATMGKEPIGDYSKLEKIGADRFVICRYESVKKQPSTKSQKGIGHE